MNLRFVHLAALVVGVLPLGLRTQHSVAASPEAATRPAIDTGTIGQAYPGLTSGALTWAAAGELPKGLVLKAGDYTVSEQALQAEIAKAPPTVQEQLRINSLFLLEQMATRELLVREAKQSAGSAASDLTDRGLIQALFEKLTAGVKVTDAEIASFYEMNRDMVGGAKLEDVREAISKYLLQQKRQELVDQRVRTIGQRTPIVVTAAWLKTSAEAARNNPVDKARGSGKPSLVDFGAKGCIPCEKLAPILDAMKAKYQGKANVVFVSVREEQVLASRYGIESIPVQIFFDKDGKEVSRHTGFWPQEELERKLVEIGVK